MQTSGVTLFRNHNVIIIQSFVDKNDTHVLDNELTISSVTLLMGDGNQQELFCFLLHYASALSVIYTYISPKAPFYYQ